MPKHAIQVAVRTRPTASFASKNLTIEEDSGAIEVQLDPSADAVSNRQDHWKFKFNNVLYNSGQEHVFDHLVAPVVSGVMSGTNGCVMAYGQTGAGKTYTMLGDQRIYSNRGVSPRAISAVFAEISSRPETDFSVQVSYLEIYNERIYDLLLPPGTAAPSEYALTENKRGVSVRGLTSVEVTSEEEALHQLFSGQGNRTTAQHQLNGHSNRSHCIFTLRVSQRSRLGTAERTLHSKLNLVDLAGSERLKKTMATTGGLADETLSRESMFINKSLSHLEQCVVALTSSSRSHIPYRSSKLTNILKDSLGGNCATLLIACVWGEASHLEETLSTLKLAQRMMRVTNRREETVSLDPALLAKRYEKQIAQLQQELLMHDALSDRSAVVYTEYTPEQRQQLGEKLRRYVAAETPQAEEEALQIDSVRMMRELLVQMKIMVKGLYAQLEDGAGGARAASSMSGGASGRAPSAAGGGFGSVDAPEGAVDRGGFASHGDLVGELDASAGGVGLGLAPPGSRPDDMHASRLLASQRQAQAAEDAAADGAVGGGGTPRRRGEGKSGEDDAGVSSAQSREEAWAWYRSEQGPGRDMALAVAEAAAAHRDAKAQYKAVGRTVNTHKNNIDALTAGVERKRAEAERSGVPVDGAGEVIVDEEEYRLRSELADAKRAYKAAFGELKARRTAVEAAAAAATGAKQALVHAFEAWFEDSYGGQVGAGGMSSSALFGTPAASPSRSPGGGTVGFGGGDASVGAPLASTWTSPSRSVRKGSPGRGGLSMSARDMHATAATAAALLGRGASAPRGALRNEAGDVLDDGEAFERMEFERIVGEDPDSVAYYAAQKKLASSMKGSLSVTQRRSLAQRRMS